jgi:hypothetical protein
MKIRTITSAAFLALAVIGAAGCAVNGAPNASEQEQIAAPKENPKGTGEKTTAKIDNSTGGKVELPGGATLDVPAGALPPGVEEITVTSSPEAAPVEYKAVSPVLVFEPEGTVFLKPLKITMPVTVPTGTSTAELTVLWSRTGVEGFDMLPTEFTLVDAKSGSHSATAEATHFSRAFCGRRYTTDPFPPADPYAGK